MMPAEIRNSIATTMRALNTTAFNLRWIELLSASRAPPVVLCPALHPIAATLCATNPSSFELRETTFFGRVPSHFHQQSDAKRVAKQTLEWQ